MSNTSESGKPRTTTKDAAKAAARRAGQVLKEMEYPHGIHPALVPGVSVEDQKIRYGVDRPILVGVGIIIAAFVTWGAVSPDGVLAASTAGLNWITTNLGWLFTSLAIGMVLFLLAVAFSRYGRIPLGLDGEKPEYSTISWAAMLFGAGIGIGIIFFGPLEPLTYYVSPLPGLYEPGTVAAVKGSLAQAAFHWGLNAWAMYAIVGLAVAYVSYRKGRVPLMSSILTPLWGGGSTHWGARLIDGLAIIATLFGTAASLGIGALQIGRGFELVSGWSPAGNTAALVIIVVLTIGTIISAVSGVARGIRRLSNINLILAIALAVFFFVVGPTVFLVNIIPGVIVEYFGNIPQMLSATTADSPEVQQFLSSWTIFYWAWWVSWAPFVGVFTAKISRGRTVRQFILGVLLIPSTIIILAFTVLGGTTVWLQHTTGELVPGNDPANLPKPEEAFFVMLDHLPNANLIAPVVMVMLAVFFITTSDSASLVNSQLSQRGNPYPNPWVTAFWALCMAGIAAVMLLMGGRDVLQGLQNLITITALPFSVILVLMAVALVREMRLDPMMLRQRYEQAAVANAVRHGIVEHGDHFELSISRGDPDAQVLADFDSTAEDVTSWYTRTDEEGNPVEYDYDTGTYPDDPPAEPDEDDEVDAR
ncbi:BCCT family transporter [uncultured Tessaracoccus sp.]|uniref:BCCT family transporter n=1 Tax=uncultured Tessaracoccus sp. TaxID=905023 RepID=UPI0025FA10BC|nr:BCCT family transporter [uncultured Tessaracoccus sp.]